MAKVFQVDTGGTLTTNLIDYYKLEDGTDYWGGYNLTNVGGVTFEAGKVNNAAQYGTAQDRDLRTLQTLGINGGSISISVWVNITTAPDNNLSQSIVEQFNTANKVGYSIYYSNVGGTMNVYWDRYKRGVISQVVSIAYTLTPGTWYHIVLRYDGTTLEGFINNVSKGTVAASGNGTTSDTDEFSIGVRITGGNPVQRIKGLIDETGVWNKNLVAQEITDLYNGGAGQTMILKGTTGASVLMQLATQ